MEAIGRADDEPERNDIPSLAETVLKTRTNIPSHTPISGGVMDSHWRLGPDEACCTSGFEIGMVVGHQDYQSLGSPYYALQGSVVAVAEAAGDLGRLAGWRVRWARGDRRRRIRVPKVTRVSEVNMELWGWKVAMVV